MHDHLISQFRRLHARIADVLRGLDDAGCNWAPAEGTNPISTIVVHLLGSEAEAFGLAPGRDRPSEFVPKVRPGAELLARLEQADAALPPPGGVDLLRVVANLGHAGEHIGELLLTAQLYRDARARATGATPCATRR
jgi:hypothetical protein